jgi:uncharacterized CHY-type Zn-finger protein
LIFLHNIYIIRKKLGGKYMRCPRCGSENISSIIDTKTHTKGFDGGDACCGYLLFGWPGVLCGLCNTGDTTTTTKTTNICNDCGNRF